MSANLGLAGVDSRRCPWFTYEQELRVYRTESHTSSPVP
jgi:hypothetical protein